MSLLSHHAGSRQVVELDEVIDPDIEDAVEGVPQRLVRTDGASVAVVDLHTPPPSAAAALARGCPSAHRPETVPRGGAGKPASVRRTIGRLLRR
ncbi:hypothetical protein ACFYPC_30735 [Streptomyces sp. NPDC005808]|uniref:hypothetical protein n=1 Tax=Streptomyces sp. NPDC005808 TaxID=3364734 RepID=UPI0036D01C98